MPAPRNESSSSDVRGRELLEVRGRSASGSAGGDVELAGRSERRPGCRAKSSSTRRDADRREHRLAVGSGVSER